MSLPTCPHCSSLDSSSESRSRVVRFGRFVRNDGSSHQRYRCRSCGKTFSDAFFNISYRFRRREINRDSFGNIVSCVSMRRTAFLRGCTRRTIERRVRVFGQACEAVLMIQRELYPPAQNVEFDDLETYCHTKMKPLSVIAMVETKSHRILGLGIAEMPAKGRLAKKSLLKYGERADERKQVREDLFALLKPHVASSGTVKSDQNPHYPPSVKKYFAECTHVTYRGRRAAEIGQGELKVGGFDPLFALNHTFASFRDNLKRLSRRTWCTTKKKEFLKWQLAMVVIFQNAFRLFEFDYPLPELVLLSNS